MQDIDQYSMPDFKVVLPPISNTLLKKYPDYSLTRLMDKLDTLLKPKFETYYNKINEENSSVLQNEK